MKTRACLGLAIVAIVAGSPVPLSGAAWAAGGDSGAALGAETPRQDELEWVAAQPPGGAILDLTTVPVEPPRGEEPDRPLQLVLAAGLGVWHAERGDEAWEMYSRPGRTDNVIAAPGGGIYVAGPDGAMRSTTGGRTWAKTEVRRGEAVRFLAASPDWDTDGAVYAITPANGRLYKAEKGRSSWAEIILVTGEEHWTGAVAFSPLHSDDETIFAGTDVGVFKSSNNGQRWTKVSDDTGPIFGPEGGPPWSQGLLVSPDYGDDPSRLGDAEDDTLFAFNGSGLFISEDDGVRWRKLPLAVDRVNDLAVSTGWPYDQTLMAAVADDDGTVVAVSTDGGATWERRRGPDGVAGTAVAMSVDYAPPYRGQPRNGIWLPMVVMESAVATGPGAEGPEGSREAFLATDGDGVWRTRDGGATWQRLTAGLAAVEVTALAMLPGGSDARVLAGTTMTGLYISDDGARTWTAADSALPRGREARINAVVPSPDFDADGTVLLAADDGVWRSQDGGATWRRATGAPAPVATVALSPDFGADGLAMVPGAVSADGGATWRPVTGTLGALGIAFSPDFASDATVWAGGVGGLTVSTDGGTSWRPVEDSSLRGRDVYGVDALVVPNSVDPMRVFLATSRGVVLSQDGGETWDRARNALSRAVGVVKSRGFEHPSNAVVLAVGDGGAAYSVNRGIDWTRDANAPDPGLAAAVSDDGCVLVVGGAWWTGRAYLASQSWCSGGGAPRP